MHGTEHRNQERGERRKDGPKREIAEDPEGMKEREQLFVQQPVKQENSNAGSNEFSLILLGVASGRTQVKERRICGVNVQSCKSHPAPHVYFGDEDVFARFPASINLGRMSFSIIVFGGVESAL